MRQTRGMRLWSVVYPILLYFAVCQALSAVQAMLPVTSGFDAVMRQGVDTLGGLAVLWFGFLRGKKLPDGVHGMKTGKQMAFGYLSAVLMLGFGSFVLNNLLALTDVLSRSEGYRFVEQSFYSSSLFFEIAVLCILTPIAEELLYREIVFRELRGWLGRWGAVFVSALLFGVMHMNLVQMIYAFGLGLLLGLLMERYGDVRIAMCGHIAANLLSVLRTELGLLTGLEKEIGTYWFVTMAALAAAAGLAGWHAGKMLREDA